ncbi:MAG: protein phosphatase 2C domain-containing protein, partial [Anaerolineae bacterium]|nr:protein phosphatase 2C domain-containing protein [Anaerolineae bacterium]
MSESPSNVFDVQIAMQTDVGQKRPQNQDAIGRSIPENPAVLALLGRVFVLADGVGGLPGGDLASQYAVSTVLRAYFDPEYDEPDPATRLARAIVEANTVIYEEGQSQDPPTTMATTIVAAVIRGSDLILGSVGDSPAYLLRGGEARQLTQDHNLETIQRAAGVDAPSDHSAGRKLVRALGHTPSVKVDIITGRVREGDTVVLCSDGLTRYIAPEEIEATATEYGIADAVPALIETANARGGADNISVIMLHIAENAEHLLSVRDPMESWGQPRRAGRQPKTPAPKTTATAAKPSGDPGIRALIGSLAQQALDFIRSNTVITGVGLAALLVVFVIIMVLIAGVGDDAGDSGTSGEDIPQPTHTPPSIAQTETMAAGLPD